MNAVKIILCRSCTNNNLFVSIIIINIVGRGRTVRPGQASYLSDGRGRALCPSPCMVESSLTGLDVYYSSCSLQSFNGLVSFLCGRHRIFSSWTLSWKKGYVVFQWPRAVRTPSSPDQQQNAWTRQIGSTANVDEILVNGMIKYKYTITIVIWTEDLNTGTLMILLFITKYGTGCGRKNVRPRPTPILQSLHYKGHICT